MLLLHAADLHLGKTLYERDISQDQEAMLEGLLELLAVRRPAALLLAGDLYDRSIPPPEAVRLFDSFLSRAVAFDPGLVVVAIPGNHDSAARLSFGTQIMSKAGVHIRTDPRLCVEPIVVERDGERVAIWALPFLGPGAFEPRVVDDDPPAPVADGQAELEFDAQPQDESVAGLRGQADLFAEAMRRMRPLLGSGGGSGRPERNVLVAHCFAAGAASSESERTFVGAAEQVDSASFAAFDYVALGHMHRFQRAGAKGRYSGSPLAYSFLEGEEAKGFVLVDLKTDGGFDAELIPLTPLHAMRRIEGPFSVLAAPGAFPECRGDFVEARLTDPEPVLNPADPLRANFPNLLSVRQAAFELAAGDGRANLDRATFGRDGSGADASGLAERPRSIVEDFVAFYAEMKATPPDEEISSLFASLVREAERETL